MPALAFPETRNRPRTLDRQDLGLLLLPLALLFFTALASMQSSGLYMDAVNPDYMVLRLLDPESRNVPIWILAGNLLLHRFPVLVNVYHGAVPFYTGLPFYILFGTGIEGIRLANAGIGATVLVLLHAFLRSFGVSRWIAIPILCLLAVDPAFVLSLRTQFYITLQPIGFVLLSAALLSHNGPPGPVRTAASGFFAGLSVYGYFIYSFVFIPLALFAISSLRHRGAPRRLYLLWALATAAGAIGYPFGFALAWLASGGTAGFLEMLHNTVRSLSPDDSHLSLLDRLRIFLSYARLSLEAQGNIQMLLGEPIPLLGRTLRYVVLASAAAIGLVGMFLARSSGRGVLLVIGLALAYLGLALAFGDRLWVHHFSALPVLFYALLALLLQAAISLGGALGTSRVWIIPLLLITLLVPLGAVNLMNFFVASNRLEQTGGNGLSSDSIVRFGEDIGRMQPAPLVVTPDWGVFMPVAMISRGGAPIITDFSAARIRQELCAGRDVVLGLMVNRGADRVAGWTRDLGWSEPALTPYTQRDGRPSLLSVHWRANIKPDGTC